MAKAGSTYRAVHVVSPGKLELTEKPLLDPKPGHVRVRVEACGVCHSDSFTVEGAFFRSNGRASRVTRRWGALIWSAPVRRAGRSASALA
jgi:NADPH:quinone reductase-like Zn-dependent oxidoreductase